MTNLADLLPAGGGQNNTEFVADGNISAGAPVILTSDGKAAPISSASGVVGAAATFESATTQETAAVYDSNSNKVVVVYRDDGNSYYATSVVGTITGGSTNTVSWGTPVVFASYGCNAFAPVFQSHDNQIVCGFQAWGGGYASRIQVIAGEVNGTSMDWYSSGAYDPDGSSGVDYVSAAYDSNAQKTVLVWVKSSATTESCVVSVSGTGSSANATTGSVAQVNGGGDARSTSCCFDSNSNKMVVLFNKVHDSYKGFGRVGTVSGTSISYGTEAQFMSGKQPLNIGSAFDTSVNKVVITGADNANNSQGDCCLGTVSSTDITYSTPVVFSTGNGSGVGNLARSQMPTIYNPDTNKTFVAYFNIGDNYAGEYVEGTVSGSTISFGSATTFEAGVSGQIGANYIGGAYDTNVDRFLVSFVPYATGPYYGQGRVIQVGTSPLTSTNLLGIAAGAISDTATGTINTWGSRNEVQTGLTIGSDYYVQTNGNIQSPTALPTYDLGTAALVSSFSVASQDTAPNDFAFNTDGTKMYVVGYTNDAVYQYSLSTAFTISTASYDSVSFSIASQSSLPTGLTFNNDGTKMYVVCKTNDAVYQYSLSSGFDLSTASYDSVSLDVSPQDNLPNSIRFNANGTKMYIVGAQYEYIFQYGLSSAFDLSTASYDSVYYDFNAQGTDGTGLAFSPDGTRMFIVCDSNNTAFQYSLSSGYDLSTVSYDSKSLTPSDTNPSDIRFSADGTKIFIIGRSEDKVFQYTTADVSSTYLIGKAITATQINIKDYTG